MHSRPPPARREGGALNVRKENLEFAVNRLKKVHDWLDHAGFENVALEVSSIMNLIIASYPIWKRPEYFKPAERKEDRDG